MLKGYFSIQSHPNRLMYISSIRSLNLSNTCHSFYSQIRFSAENKQIRFNITGNSKMMDLKQIYQALQDSNKFNSFNSFGQNYVIPLEKRFSELVENYFLFDENFEVYNDIMSIFSINGYQINNKQFLNKWVRYCRSNFHRIPCDQIAQILLIQSIQLPEHLDLTEQFLLQFFRGTKHYLNQFLKIRGKFRINNEKYYPMLTIQSLKDIILNNTKNSDITWRKEVRLSLKGYLNILRAFNLQENKDKTFLTQFLWSLEIQFLNADIKGTVDDDLVTLLKELIKSQYIRQSLIEYLLNEIIYRVSNGSFPIILQASQLLNKLTELNLNIYSKLMYLQILNNEKLFHTNASIQESVLGFKIINNAIIYSTQLNEGQNKNWVDLFERLVIFLQKNYNALDKITALESLIEISIFFVNNLTYEKTDETIFEILLHFISNADFTPTLGLSSLHCTFLKTDYKDTHTIQSKQSIIWVEENLEAKQITENTMLYFFQIYRSIKKRAPYQLKLIDPLKNSFLRILVDYHHSYSRDTLLMIFKYLSALELLDIPFDNGSGYYNKTIREEMQEQVIQNYDQTFYQLSFQIEQNTQMKLIFSTSH